MVRRFFAVVAGSIALLGAVGQVGLVHAAVVPVLVVSGLTATTQSLAVIQSRLQRDGFTTFVMQLPDGPDGIPGTGDIARSGEAVAERAHQVLAQTGASRLDVVGHSEGGLALRYYLKDLGGAAQVRRYVSLGTPQHGTLVANLTDGITSVLGCTACEQMSFGSIFLANLNSPTDTPGAVAYTALATDFDEAVIPAPRASYLRDGGTDATVQQFCPFHFVEHLGLTSDAVVYQLARSALLGQPLHTNCAAT